jgi:hypothetical protein
MSTFLYASPPKRLSPRGGSLPWVSILGSPQDNKEIYVGNVSVKLLQETRDPTCKTSVNWVTKVIRLLTRRKGA